MVPQQRLHSPGKAPRQASAPAAPLPTPLTCTLPLPHDRRVDSESQPVVVLGSGYELINGRRGEEFPHWTEEIVPLEDPREVASFGGAVEEQLHPAPGGALEQQPQPAPVCDAAVPAHSLAKVVLVGVAALVLLRGRMRVTCS